MQPIQQRPSWPRMLLLLQQTQHFSHTNSSSMCLWRLQGHFDSQKPSLADTSAHCPSLTACGVHKATKSRVITRDIAASNNKGLGLGLRFRTTMEEGKGQEEQLRWKPRPECLHLSVRVLGSLAQSCHAVQRTQTHAQCRR